MENKVPKVVFQSSHRPWVWLMITGVLLLFMNQNVLAQEPCTNAISYTLVGVDASGPTTNDAKIRISGALSGDHKVGYSVGAAYTGPAFADAPKFSTLTGGYLSQTLATPSAPGGTQYTIRVFSVDGTCYTDQSFTLEYVNFNTLPVNPDVELVVTHTGGEYVNLNGTVTVTVAIENKGTGPATGVAVTVLIPEGFTSVSANTAAGSYSNGIWTVGTLAAGSSAVSLTLTGTISTRGVKYVTAEVTAMNETDIDSSPTSHQPGEDDQGAACISTPFDYCSNDEYKVVLPIYTGIKWFKDGQQITAENAAGKGVQMNSDSSITILSEGVYSYTMLVGPGACLSGNCCPIKVEPGKPPVLALTDEQKNQSICHSDTFVAITTTNSQSEPNGTFIYQWYNDNGTNNAGKDAIAGQTSLNFSALPTAVGVYKYKLLAYEEGHENCADSVSVTLTIRDLPVALISSNNPLAVCEESTISLVADGAGEGGKYAWTGPDNFIASVASPERPNAITAFAGTYIVTVTNGLSCSATASVEVVINILPLKPNAHDVVVCAESPAVTLVADPQANTSNTILWYGNNATGGEGSTTIAPHNPTSAGFTYYYVSQVDDKGCESHRDTLTVQVDAKPAPPVAMDYTYCQGVEAVAIALQTPAAVNHAVLWYGEAATGGESSNTAPTPPTNDVKTTYWYVSQKDNLTGCESNRDSSVVIVNRTPDRPVIAAVTYCEQDAPQALIATGEQGNTIVWHTGVGTSTTAPPVTTDLAGLTYFYVSQIIPGTECESGMAALPVTVNPKPVAEVIAVNSLCVGTVSQNNAQMVLTRYRNSDEVSYNVGETYSSATPTTYANPGTGGVFASNLSNPATANQTYTVRIKNSFGCTTDRFPVLTKTECSCPGGYCEPATITKKLK